MKLNNTLVALLYLMAAPSLLQAMQPREPRLIIVNSTGTTIKLWTKQGEHKSTWHLDRRKRSEIQSPQTLNELDVIAPGRVMDTPYHIIKDVKAKLAEARTSRMDVQITVTPSASTWNPLAIAYDLVGRTTPQQIYRYIYEYFPLVNAAIAERREVLPYYFLNLQANAPLASVTSAYEQEVQKLSSLIANSSSDDKRFYTDALEFVQMAYQAITGGASKLSQFANYVEEKLVNAPTAYEAHRPSPSTATASAAVSAAAPPASAAAPL